MPDVSQQVTQLQPASQRSSWKKIVIGVVIGVILLGIGVFAFNLYQRGLEEVIPAKVRTPKTATPSIHKTQPKAPESETIKRKTKDPYQIKIVGDNNCKSKTNQSLSILKSKAEVHYSVVINNVGIIECSESGSGIYVWEEPPRYKVGQATMDTGTIWYAGTIVHEACHSKQYHDYLFDNSTSYVPSNVYSGKSAEAQCLDAQYDSLVYLEASQGTLDYVKNIINSEYWDVDYSDRWW